MQTPVPLGTSQRRAHDIFLRQRDAYMVNPYPCRQDRLDHLSTLKIMIEVNEKAIVEAINTDFGGRSEHETILGEIYVVLGAISHARAHLKRWMQTRRIKTELPFLPGSNALMPQPLGVVGVVAPWNYPLQLSLGPTVAAIAAGNNVLIKPSELTPTFSCLLQELIARAIPEEKLAVINGDAQVAQDFVSLPFDHLMFTGSTQVGIKVAKAAAANLTPVTLELGGKSPAIIDASCDLSQALPRLAFGKLLNAGQTCIAPDYLLVPRGRSREVVEGLTTAIAGMYPTLLRNPDYSSIVSDRHRERLIGLIADARKKGAVVTEVNPSREALASGTRKLAPTLITDIDPSRSLRVMEEEIFGPVLPILEYDGIDEAVRFVNQRERPLALYWFGKERSSRDAVLQRTHAGGVTVNDCLWHLAQENQPFGGVGKSGMGAYHGQWGFERFSHLKPVFKQARLSGGALLRPPYGRTFSHLMSLLRSIA